MPIRFRCASCQTTLQAPDSASGKNAKCTSCGTMVRIAVPATAIPAGSKPATVVPATAIPSGNTAPKTQPTSAGQVSTSSAATLKCGNCARTLRPPAGSEGKRVKCPCGAVLTIPSAAGNAHVAGPAMFDQSVAGSASQPTAVNSTSSESSWLDTLPSASTSPPAYSPFSAPAAPPPYSYAPPAPPYTSDNSATSSRTSMADMYLAQAAAQSSPDDDYVERGQTWSVDWAKVGGGILVMAGAAAWFFGAWILAGRIYIYPPIMFLGGLIAVVNGLFSGD